MNLNRHKTILYISCLFLVSIVYSKFLLSICMILFFSLAIYYSVQSKDTLKPYITRQYIALLSLLFFAILFSGIHSSDTNEWMHHVQLKLPYLILPFSMWVFRASFIKYYIVLHQAFIIVVFISVIPVFINILTDYPAHLKSLGLGQSAETPVDHIKYSIFLAFACLSSLGSLIQKNKTLTLPIPNWFFVIASLTMFILLHLLAVRSGLVLFYTSFLIMSIIIVVRLKKYIWLTAVFFFLVASPVIMYKTIPSIEAKIGYMRYDIDQYLKGGGSQYSDSERWVSIQSGITLFKKNPVFGTGIGDLLEETNSLMEDKLTYRPNKFPHNQFIFFLSGTGLFGFILFMLSFFLPWRLFPTANLYFILLAVLILLSFLVENTLERSYSTAFFCFFYGLGILDAQATSDQKINI